VRIIYGYESIDEDLGPIVMTIGTYDGLHVGHQAIIRQVVERAKKTGARSLVYSFYPPPWRVIGRGKNPWLILTLKDKIELLDSLGVDFLVTEEFTPAIQEQTHVDFAEEVLGRRIGAREIHFGYDFAFGKDRKGDVHYMRQTLGQRGVDIRPHGAIRLGGEVVGCTRVRELVCDGDVDGAAPLLGRFHFVRGVVVKGRGRGRTIDYPTANVHPETELLPPAGVYAVQLTVGDGEPMPAIANLGFRPTFAEQDFSVEVHVFDFDGDLYGERVRVDFIHRVRAEQKFDGPEQLVAQIDKDVAAVKASLPWAVPPGGALTWDPKPA
jgi:riboflavin kinase/FMN adenylyltransferase